MRKRLLIRFKAFVGRYSRRGFRRRFLIINQAYLLINRFITPDFVVAQGHRMVVDKQDSLNLSVHGVYEPFETSLVKQHIKKGDTVLDIGANIGYYTLIFASLVGDEGKVVAFEPEPELFQLLTRNIDLNQYRNVIPVQKAVAEGEGVTKLFIDTFSSVDHRMYDSEDGRESVEIEMVSLDRFLQAADRNVDFIKMDIQGAEGSALKGMDALIRQNRRLMMITEFWPAGLARCGTDPREFVNALLGLGFSIQEIDEAGAHLAPVASAGRLVSAYSVSGFSQTNLLCKKG